MDLTPVAVGRVAVRSLLTRSVLGERKFGFRYSVNPYRGCPHACRYCYASSVTRDARPWGSVVDIKEGAADVLAAELRRAPPGLTLVSSATDPYPPQESQARVTRSCLELLKAARFPVSILTRSPLVLRDLDVFAGWPGLDVGCSFVGLHDRRDLEPRVPPVRQRLTALRRLLGAGVTTWASIAPLLPGTEPEELRELLGALAEHGVRQVFVDPLLLDPYPDALRRMESEGFRGRFDPGEAGRLVEVLEEEGRRQRVQVHRRFLGWRKEAYGGRGREGSAWRDPAAVAT